MLDRLRNLSIESLLRAGSSAVFLGWGLLHLFFDVPYRALFWSQDTFSGVVTHIFGLDWHNYATNPIYDGRIQLFIQIVGAFLLYASFVAAKKPSGKVRDAVVLSVGAVVIFCVALLKFRAASFQLAMFVEYSSQFAIPAALVFHSYLGWSRENVVDFAKVAVVGTFLGHGLYAIGAYDVPGHFIDMLISIFGVTESQAKEMLFIAGAIDLLLCVLIWIPKWQVPALAYCTFWGFVTALARPAAFINLGVGDSNSLFYWVCQAAYRMPHAILPFALIVFALKFDRARRERATVTQATLPMSA